MRDPSAFVPLVAALKPFVGERTKRRQLVGAINDALAAVQSSLPGTGLEGPVLADFKASYDLLVESVMVMQELERTPWGTHSPETKLGRRLLAIHRTLREHPNAESQGLDAMDRYKTGHLHSSRLVFELLIEAPWDEFMRNARDLCLLFGSAE